MLTCKLNKEQEGTACFVDSSEDACASVSAVFAYFHFF